MVTNLKYKNIVANLISSYKMVGTLKRQDIYKRIKTSNNASIIETARQDGKYSTDYRYEVQGKPSNYYNYAKRTLIPAWTPCANFVEKPSLSDAEAILTKALYLDIDGLDNVEEVKELLAKDNNVEACWVSFGGNGLGFIVKVEEITKENFEEVYNSVATYYENKYDIKLDRLKDYTRRCVLSYDPNIYVNLNAESLEVAKLPKVEVKKPVIEREVNETIHLDNIVEALGGRTTNSRTNYKSIFYKIEREKGAFVEGNTHKFSLSLIGTMNIMGIPVDDWYPEFIEWLKDTDCYKFLEEDKLENRIEAYRNQLNTNPTIYQAGYNAGSFEVEKGKFNLYDGQYLSDIIKVEDLADNVLIVAPVGAGKSHFALNVLSEATGKLIFVAPQQSIITNIAESYKGDKTIGTYYEKEKNTTTDIILTTYNSLPSLLKQIGDKIEDYCIVLDEFHTLVTTSSKTFRYSVNKKVAADIEFLTKNTNVIALTATPVRSYLDKYFKRIVVEDRRSPIKEINVKLYSSDERTVLVNAAIGYLEVSDKVIIYKNDKNIEELAMKLRGLGKKVAVLNASVKESSDYITVVNEGDITDFDILITTSVLKEGVSVKGAKTVTYIVADRCHYLDVEQLTSRVRDYQKAYIVMLYRTTNTFNFSKVYNYDNSIEDINIFSKGLARRYNDLGVIPDVDTKVDIANRGVGIKYDTVLGNWEIDDLYVSYLSFEEEEAVCIANPAYFLNALMTLYNYDIDSDVEVLNLETVDFKEEIKKVSSKKTKDAEEIKDILLNQVIGKRKEEAIEYLSKVAEETKNKQLAERAYIIKEVLKYSTYDNVERAFKFASKLTKNKLTSFKKQLEINYLITAEDLENQKKGLNIQKFYKEVATLYKVNDEVDSDTVIEAVSTLIDKYNIGLKGGKREIINLFTGIYGVEFKQKRKNGKIISAYKITSLNAEIEGYKYNNSTFRQQLSKNTYKSNKRIKF